MSRASFQPITSLPLPLVQAGSLVLPQPLLPRSASPTNPSIRPPSRSAVALAAPCGPPPLTSRGSWKGLTQAAPAGSGTHSVNWPLASRTRPSTPGKVPKYSSKLRFSCMITITCLILWMPWAAAPPPRGPGADEVQPARRRTTQHAERLRGEARMGRFFQTDPGISSSPYERFVSSGSPAPRPVGCERRPGWTPSRPLGWGPGRWDLIQTGGRLLATADLHVDCPENRTFLDALEPGSAADWLLVAGDVAERVADIEWALRL